ncbi:MAG: hypothetical protein KBD85_06400 [Elusimicrobia bacterium]|nr:hypothetical protein [Elusimicrobiota bacterium]
MPKPLARFLDRRARAEKTSLNRVAIQIMEESVGLGSCSRRVVHHDMDWFFGSAHPKEARLLEKSIREQRRIEPEAWK